jgi:uncharacterized damage-inducible protein DinB
MQPQTETLLAQWIEARTRFTNQLTKLIKADLQKRLPPSPNSVGFLIRHIGDVELLFAKNVFGDSSIKLSAQTVIAQKDTGEWIHLEELLSYVAHSFSVLETIVKTQTDADWNSIITTKEFGTKTKAEAFGRIVSHTAYHSGQMAILVKYGI